LVSSNITPVMAWKISVPGVINTGVQIYQQTHKKSDGRVKAPEHFNPRGVWVKTSRDRTVNLPAGDYFVRLKPRTDVRLHPQTTQWFRVSKHTFARVIVENSGVRRIEFRIDGIKKYSYDRGILFAQAAPKFPVPSYPVPANDNLPARLLVPSEAAAEAETATAVGEALVAAEALTLDGLVALVAANPLGLAIITAAIVTEVYILPTLAVTETTSSPEVPSVQQPKTQAQPEQNPRQQTSPEECWDEEFPAISSGKRPNQAPKDNADEIAWKEMHGSTSKVIDRFPADARRLAALYGGKAEDWARRAYQGYREVHWLENEKTGQKVEFIFKNPCKITHPDCDDLTGANAITGKTTHFTAKNPGPLSYIGEAKNFTNVQYTKVIINKWVRLYRVWGGDVGVGTASQFGGYWTRMPITIEQLSNPAFVQKLRDMFALPEAWNPIKDVVMRDYKPGTVMYVGKAAKQAAFPQYAGQAEQIFMDQYARQNFGVDDCHQP